MTGAAPLAFTGVECFDGTSFVGSRTVVIRDGRIAAFGAGCSVEVPGDAEVVAGEGRTLLPGFIDLHVHIGIVKPARVLAGGITTARDLGWPEGPIFRLVDELADARVTGPRLLAAGPMLTAPGGYPTRAGWGPKGTGREVASPLEGAKTVRALASRGACVIKVAQEPRSGPTLAPEVLRAIVDAAHEEGLGVTSHLGSLDQLTLGLELGVDELAHGLWSNEQIPAEVLERMVGAGTVVVPTLHIDPSRARLDNLERFLAAGGVVLYGTDMGNSGPPPGIDSAELALMLRAGMRLEDALASATTRAADHLALPALGRIAAGAVADLVLVDGDPRTSLSALDHPILVLREGCRPGRGKGS